MEYRKHLVDLAHASPEEEVQPGIRGSFYEELIEIPLNGHFEYIYLIASKQMCYVIHRRDVAQGTTNTSTFPLAPSCATRT
jgi:hypothetical protein